MLELALYTAAFLLIEQQMIHLKILKYRHISLAEEAILDSYC